MKHILPILTVALAFTAMTASAATTYTEYSDETFLANTSYSNKYGNVSNVTPSNGVYDYGSYKVIKTGTSLFKIHAVENIDVYIYDFISDVGAPNNTDNIPLDEGTSLKDRKVNLIGYRTQTDNTEDVIINSDTNEEVVGSNGYKGEVHSLGTPTESEIIHRNYQDGAPYDVVRNTYYLGKFEAGQDYEIFLSAEGPLYEAGAWSNSDWAANYQLYVDKLMAAYKAQSFGSFDNEASKKYMHLAGLNGAAFGIYVTGAGAHDTVVGSPLPGGVQIALITGLFGLGFWYIRRRKSVVA